MIYETGGRRHEVITVRKRGLKHVTIRVTHAGELRVSVPLHMSSTDLKRALAGKERWIAQKLERVRRYADRLDTDRFITIEGHELEVVAVPSDDATEPIVIEPSTGRCLVAVGEEETASAVLHRTLLAEGRSTLPAYARSVAEGVGVPVLHVYVRNQRTRWGASSNRGNLSLNWRLVMAPEEVRDYLVLHEAAHQRHMNHSRRFWELVAHWCPGYAEHDRWLTEHAYLLATFRDPP